MVSSGSRKTLQGHVGWGSVNLIGETDRRGGGQWAPRRPGRRLGYGLGGECILNQSLEHGERSRSKWDGVGA